jgi:hypothetical protein
MRTNATQLPSFAELKEIIKREGKRMPSLGKENKHFPDFTLIRSLYEEYGADPSVFNSEFTLEKLNQENISLIGSNLTTVVESILSNPDKDICNKIYDYLSEEDNPEKGDLIFVFGNAFNYRIDKAIELFKSGYSDKIMISGRGPIYEKVEQTEGEKLKLYAVQNGVPERSIITEHESISIPDNVKRSLNLLDEKGFRFSKILVVNSPFAQRRGWTHFSKFTDAQLIRVNSQNSEKYQKDKWYKDEETIRIYLNEFLKMKIGVALNSA